jgi:hypothetical protein
MYREKKRRREDSDIHWLNKNQEEEKKRREDIQVSDRFVPQTGWETRTTQVEQATASRKTNQQRRMKKKTPIGSLNAKIWSAWTSKIVRKQHNLTPFCGYKP